MAAGQTDCAKLFLSFGARDSAQDKQLRCCIHIAVEQNREETLDMLLKETRSSLVNVPDHKQRTALHYASYADNSKVVSPFWYALALPLSLCMGLSEEIEVSTKIDIGHNNAATILVIKVTIAIAIPINFHSVIHAMTSEKSAKKTRSFFIFSFTSSSGLRKAH